MKKDRNRQKRNQRERRKKKVRKSITSNITRPRLSVFRSLKHIACQIIDDTKGVTLVAASDADLKGKKGKKSERAEAVGALIAEKALAKKITIVRFDRGHARYHGRIKAIADGARKAGLKF